MSMRAPHLLRMMVQSDTINLKITPQARKQVNIIAGRLFSDHYSAAKESVHLDRATSVSGTYGDFIRRAYHDGLEQAALMASTGHLKSLYEGSESPLESAKIAQCIRESVKMQAWEAMPVEDADRLRERNIEKYGREEGPDFDISVERALASMEESGESSSLKVLFEKIEEKALGKTSAEYNSEFGVEDYPIFSGPESGSAFVATPRVQEGIAEKERAEDADGISPRNLGM